jgi:cytochrome c553
MKNILLICLMAVMSSSHADDVSAGRAKADVACALCHGPNGIATLPNAPNLAGQQAFYVSEQLKSYRSGQRQNAVMGVIAKPLTDAEITQLAAWYSAIKVSVELP